jgi:hypothetical protein
MTTASPLTLDEQFQVLNFLDYLSDLFTGTPKASFTPTEILIILDHVRTDPDFFDPAVLIAQQTANADIDSVMSEQDEL